MASGAQSFGAQLKALREAAGYTQEELATIAGLSVHAVSALERGQRRRPHVDTLRALSSALDLTGTARDALFGSARGTTSAPSSPTLGRQSLPLAPSPMLGRDKDVEALQHLLADSSVRLVTLIGPGGVGKTRLLIELAHLPTTAASTRVVFVSLAALHEPSLVAPAVAEALGLSDVSALDLPHRAQLACGGFPTLLALDNFEHVLAAAPLVSDLLSTVGSLRVVATSREPLRLRGEREYVVEPLALSEDLEQMSPEEVSANCAAVRLFVSRVEDVQPAFRLTPANVSVVSAICRRLDALPLAIELAAPWMKVLTAEDLLRRLERNVLLSAIGPRDLPERQQTMNATVAWSYQLLSADEQRVFRRLGVLPNAFSIDAAAAVVGGREGLTSIDDVLGAVAALIQRSLLRRVDSALAGPSYLMLETVRAFAALELTASAERDDAREGLARYCVREGRRAADGLVGPAQSEWLTRVRADLESYRQTLAWLIEQGRGADAADIAWGLLFFWLIRGHVVEGIQWYSQVLDLPSIGPAADAKARLGLATLLFAQGHYDRAAAVIAPARAFFEANAETELACRASDLSARIQQGLGDLDAARHSFNRAIAGFQALALPWGAGNALLGLGGVALEVGDVDQAERLMDEAASVLQATGPWFLTRARFIRAVVWIRRGNPGEAITLLRESVASIRELHDAVGLVHALVAFASAAALKGEHAWAARILGARDVVSERTGVTVVVKHMRFLREKIEHDVRERLGAKGWDNAYAAGRRLSLDLLLKEIHRIP